MDAAALSDIAATLTAAAVAAHGRPERQRTAISAILHSEIEAARAAMGAQLDAGVPGLQAARAYAATVDGLVEGLFEVTARKVYPAANLTEAERMTVVAVGGYGRGALAPYSDLDLLFLRPWKATPHGESVIEFMLYALWDAGLKVGHASRTVDECLRLSAQDATIRTSLVDSRPVAGDRRLFADLIRRFRKQAKGKGQAAAFVAAKLEERDRRHARAGASRFLVEPNLKEGKGGLRDLDTLHWISRFLWGAAADREMRKLKGFDPRDFAALDRATDFMWAARIRLHLVSGRAEERLSFDAQPEIARLMGFEARGSASAIERFMRRYFTMAREVGALTRTFCVVLEERHAKAGPAGLSRLWPPARSKADKLETPGFRIEGGRLTVEGPKTFRREPSNLIRLFHLADRHDLDLHPQAVAAVRRALPMAGARLRKDAEAARLFLDLLAKGRNTYRALSLMTETGLLGRYIAEFNHTVGLMQFNMYHAYTVDEHTLRAVGVIGDIAGGKLASDHPLSTAVYPLITDKAALHLAMLLHDTGKGGGEDQETAGERAARAACRRLGLSPERTDLVGWLVGHHLLMSDVAQKRDLSDPRTIEAFAGEVATPERLRMLLVLTVADIRSVGPGVWNAWKGELLRELYIATEARLRGAASAEPEPHRFQPGVHTRFDEARNATEIAVSVPDRDGLFSDLAATLSDAGAEVVGAKVSTTDAGEAQDLFWVQDVAGQPFGQDNAQRLRSLRDKLAHAATGQRRRRVRAQPPGRYAAFAVAPHVAWDNEASAESTVIEASGRDRPGLLAALAAAITASGASLRSAHVGGHGERAVDAFYVQTATGEKLSKAEASALKATLLAVLETPREEPAKALVSARR